jgi:DNA-binding MarR family transcriptional regulator
MSQSILNSLFYRNLIEFSMNFKNKIYLLSQDYDLTVMQLMTLITIDQNNMSMSYYKNLFQCDASNITGLIDALVKKNLVIRSESIDDRRIKDIKLSKSGQKLQTELLQNLETKRNELFNYMPEDKIKSFIEFINQWDSLQK